MDEKLGGIPEFWVVSAPGDKTCDDTYQKLFDLIKKQGTGYVFKFPIPDFKIGTLDLLVGLSEDLAKLDSYTESVGKKLCQYLADLLDGDKDKLRENINVDGTSPAAYVTKFVWNSAKYSPRLTLKQICDAIAKNVSTSENELKSKSQTFNNLRTSIQTMERRTVGNLVTRNLGDLVKKEHFVLDSSYLITLLVVVPVVSKKDWLKKYETLTDMVVPESSSLITEDPEYCLFTVTLFRKVVDDYKTKCKENRFIVRDFEYDEDALLAGKMELTKLTDERRKQEGPLIRWIKMNVAELLSAWIHIKALRTFIESILRYGLPLNFQAMIVAPFKRSMKKMRELLNQHYHDLDISGNMDSKSDMEDIPEFNMAGTEYFPYVYFKINFDALDIPK